jgi:hypothetical protein
MKDFFIAFCIIYAVIMIVGCIVGIVDYFKNKKGGN